MTRSHYFVGGLALAAIALAVLLLAAPDKGEATFPGATNGKIAYSYFDGSSFHIAVANSDGSGQDNLTDSLLFDSAPSWSKDGTKIVFNRQVSGINRIWTMDANGDNQVQVSGDDVIGVFPLFSPDATTIYFKKLDNNLAKVSTSGGAVTSITSSGDVYEVSVSPDGALAIYNDLGNSLYTINASGGTPHPLGIQGSTASFSPDGQKIVYDVDGAIYTANANGSGVTPLHQAGGSANFSPDGRYVVFEKNITAASSVLGDAPVHIWVMDEDGDNPHELLASPHPQEYGPDWQPLGGTWTPTPSPTHSPSPTPSATPSPTSSVTPTPTPTGTALRGDGNCDGAIDFDDLIAELSEFTGVDPGAPCAGQADVDCDGDVDGDDALRMLLHLAGTPKPQPAGCGPIGPPA